MEARREGYLSRDTASVPRFLDYTPSVGAILLRYKKECYRIEIKETFLIGNKLNSTIQARKVS